jgi:hypothetical protein
LKEETEEEESKRNEGTRIATQSAGIIQVQEESDTMGNASKKREERIPTNETSRRGGDS